MYRCIYIYISRGSVCEANSAEKTGRERIKKIAADETIEREKERVHQRERDERERERRHARPKR